MASNNISMKLHKLIKRLRLMGLLTVLGSLACVAEILVGLYLILFIGLFIAYHFVFDNMIEVVPIGEVEQGQTIDIRFDYNNDLYNRHISLTLSRFIENTGEWDIIDTWDHTAQIGRNFYVSNYWTADATGYYRAYAEFYDITEGSRWGRHASTEYFTVVVATGPLAPYALKIYCGHEIKGNPGEQLNARFAHSIAVEIIDKATGQPPSQTNIPVTFTTYLQTNTPVGVPINEVSHTTWVGDGYRELAYVNPSTGIILSDQVPEAGQYLFHGVKAHCDDAESDIYLNVYSLHDAENSHLAGDTTHQTGYQFGQWIEVPGDNYLDAGNSTNYKDVKIELDYYRWNGAVYNVNQVAGFIDTVLETAGIHAEIVIDSQIPSMTDYPDRQQRMGLLANHKNPVEPFTNNARLWSNSIHVILGSNCTDNLGITEMYPESGTFNKWYTWHRGSGGLSFSAPFLDSVGCFIFTKKIQEYQGRVLELNRAIALIAAHEIGHALGMWHYPNWENDRHVMIEYLGGQAFPSQSGFEIYGRFARKTLNGDYDLSDLPNDGMNTRNVLGVNSVNSIYEGL